MDQREQRIERLDRFQQLDRRESVDGLGLDHPGLPGFEIDGAGREVAMSHRFQWLFGVFKGLKIGHDFGHEKTA